MNLTSKNITQMAKDVFRRKHIFHRQQLIHPQRDWLIGLGFGLLILVGISAWSFHMYTSNRTVEIVSTTDQAETISKVYRQAIVADALAVFAQREETFAQLFSSLQTATPATPPTSLPSPATPPPQGSTTTLPHSQATTSRQTESTPVVEAVMAEPAAIVGTSTEDLVSE